MEQQFTTGPQGGQDGADSAIRHERERRTFSLGTVRRFIAVLTCMLLLGVGVPAVAQASPGTKECGPKVCTRTYDKKTTQQWDNTFEGGGFKRLNEEWNEPGQWSLALIPGLAGKVAGLLQIVGLKLPTGGKGQAHDDVDALTSATKDAVRHNGCVQAKWDNTDKNSRIDWGYTTGRECK